MAVSFDKAGTVTHQTTFSSPMSVTFAPAATASLVIGVFTGSSATTPPIPSAMTWNSVSMTLVGNKTSSDGTANVYVYAIVAPATGSHSLSCTFANGSGGSYTADLDAFSFIGTDTSSVANCIPSGNVLTDASTPAGTNYPATAFSVTTVSGDAACGAGNSSSLGLSGTAASTTQINTEGANFVNYISGYDLATSTSTAIQFTSFNSGQPACGIAFRIKQPSSDVLYAQIMM